jgi:signal transduction histidine kinase
MRYSKTPTSVRSIRAAGGLALADEHSRPPHHHAVQFYESESFLSNLLTDFVGEGLTLGEAAIVIARPDRCAALTAGLTARGIDVGDAVARGALTILDARATLSLVMDGDHPNPPQFIATLGQVIAGVANGGAPRAVRAYGEMVDLLWVDGNAPAAIQLEELWNELARTFDFSLLCAYSMRAFTDTAHGDPMRRICDMHTHVRPTERYFEQNDDARLVEVAVLQQRALALESEIASREALEAQLRATVDAIREAGEERERLLERERLARAQAERAKAAAEQANRAKSQFLAVMSHELRTPLNAIGGYAELMDMEIHGALSAEQHDALDRIQRSQRHLLGLINQVLNYTRIETGRLRYELADLSLDDIARNVESLILPQMNARGIRYQYNSSRPPAIVHADSEKLQQILLNLIGNAIKFTDAGGRVTLECDVTETLVSTRVCDTGIGITAEKLEAIFEPFVQVDTNYTRTKDGIGLGLAISRDLARGMGGDLTVESALGSGSTFTLALPRAGA